MKPLARWTIGKTNKLGEECLRHSVRRFRTIYPEFDLVVCCNHLTPEQRSGLNELCIPVHDQKAEELHYPLMPVDSPPGWKHSMPGWGWKLVPPRLRIESHELWLDNDVVVRQRLPSIDIWLRSERSIISTALKRAYGVFDEDIAVPTPLCAGFFGLPPRFDFHTRILRYCDKLNGQPLGHYDEQGVTVRSLVEADPIIVPLDELGTVKTLQKPYPKAMHFIGINRTLNHQAWSDYKCYALM